MSLIKIRILYLSFILFFIVASVVVFLFGFGFHYNAKQRSLVQYGGIIFTVTPPAARVWIDGILYPSADPFVASRLAPGSHGVRIDFDSYFPWEKKVSVIPGISTSLGKIILFPQALPIRSPDPLPRRPLNESLAPPELFTIEETERQYRITARGVEGEAHLPRSPKARIFADRRNHFLYLFAPAEELFSLAIPHDQLWLTEIFSGITGWEDTNEWLLLWGATDLWAFDKKKHEKILVTRRGSGFAHAALFQDTTAIYSSNQSLYASDIRDRFGRQTVLIATFARVDDLFVTDTTVYILAILSQKTQTPEWFEYRVQ